VTAVLRTNDVDEAESKIAAAYLPVTIERLTACPLEVELDVLKLDTLTAGRLACAGDVRLRTADASEYHVNIPLRGCVLSSVERGQMTLATLGQAAVFMPGRSADMVWLASAAQACLMVPRAVMDSELEQMTRVSSRIPLRFETLMDLTSPSAASWRDAVEVIIRQLERGGGLAGNALVAQHLEAVLVDGLLLAHRHNYSEAIAAPRGRTPRSTIAKAVELIQDRPASPWTSVSLAREVHVSVRSLQQGFVRDTGMPPMQYLRRTRLRGVREALRKAQPADTTVALVASRFGFVHLGRFAAAYGQYYGEHPSMTLRRDVE
jgi:AraC-like DNA-binding protein